MELKLDQALQKGIEAHKSGKVQEADRYYTAILKANPKHPDANHNMGVLAVGIGKVEAALPFFKTALEVNSPIGQYWLSYIDALIKLDRIADAKAVFDQAKSKGIKWNGFDRIEKQLGSSTPNDSNAQDIPREELNTLIKLYNQNMLQQVFSKAQELTKRYTESLDLWNLMGASAAQIEQLEEAAFAFQKAIDIKPNHATAHNNMGNALKEQGKLDEAIKAYKKALAIKPDSAEANYNMGIALKDQEKLEEAIDAYKKALAIKPDYVDAFNNMGNTYIAMGKLEEAILAYQNSIKINPGNVEAWSNGAEALEKWNKLEELEHWLNKSFLIFEIKPTDIKFLHAKLLWRNKKFKEALELILTIDIKDVKDSRKKDYFNLKARCFESVKDFGSAFYYFSEMNSLAKKSDAYDQSNHEHYFQNLKRLLNQLRTEKAKIGLSNKTEKSKFNPVFLVGFPRSGTTLLDTILRSHNNIEVVEEKQIVGHVKNFLQKKGYTEILGKTSIPQHVLLDARREYKDQFEAYLEGKKPSVYIDKRPLNMLEAPLIQSLYPEAKFILSLRHPMDSILSCWMQNFKMNEQLANMVNLKRTVEFYCVAMEIFDIFRTQYGLQVHEIKYENLIEDLPGETSTLLNYLGLNWEKQLEDYQVTALKRGRIDTPSYSQVVQPIYKDAKYRWRSYQKYLEPYLDQVRPWISKFGYD